MRQTQEWLNRLRDVDLRFRAYLRHQLALWLFVSTGFLSRLKSFIILNVLGLLAGRIIALCWS